MLKEITHILIKKPALKGKEIAKIMGLNKKNVNSFLSKHKDNFVQDDNYKWSNVKKDEFRVEFQSGKWVDCLSFEKYLSKVGSPLKSEYDSVVFVIPSECSILLDAATRLLALCNQLAWQGENVTIDFSDSSDTLSYLDRIGFLQHLNNAVRVVPCRPLFSMADLFDGNSDAVVEFGEIDPNDLDESIPKKLKNAFIAHAGEEYSATAFTIISELYGNVRDHSESPIPGLVGLQYYKKGPKGPHIQTVISDSGKGIIGTLRPILDLGFNSLVQQVG